MAETAPSPVGGARVQPIKDDGKGPISSLFEDADHAFYNFQIPPPGRFIDEPTHIAITSTAPTEQREVAKLRGQLYDAQKMVKKLQQQRRVLRKNITHLNALHNEDLRLRQDTRELRDAVDRLGEENESLRQRVATLSRANHELGQQIESLSNQGNPNAKMERLERENAVLKMTVSTLTAPEKS